MKMKSKMKLEKKKAFTLIELVVVIAILLILVAVAIPKFSKPNLSAQAASHNLNVKEIKNAALLYLLENENNISTTLSENELGSYFEGKFPTPAKALNVDKFEVSVSSGGEIKVSPGEVRVEGNELVVEK